MIFLDVKVETEEGFCDGIELVDNEKASWSVRVLHALNSEMDCNENLPEKTRVYFSALQHKTKLHCLMTVDCDQYSVEGLRASLETLLAPHTPGQMRLSVKELTVDEFSQRMESLNGQNILPFSSRYFSNCYNLDYFDNCSFKVNPILAKPAVSSEREAVEDARGAMASEDFLEELHRIYAPSHPKKFISHPVHYCLSAVNRAAAEASVARLVGALYTNGRLCGRRIDWIYEITESCYSEQDMDNLFANAPGETVVIELGGNAGHDTGAYASNYEQVFEYLGKLVNRYADRVLVIVVVLAGENVAGRKLLDYMDDTLRFIPLKEGLGTRETAVQFLKTLVADSKLADYQNDTDELFALEDKAYSQSDIYERFHQWLSDSLCKRVYTAYDHLNISPYATTQAAVGAAYEKLQQLVGLEGVKQMVDQIVAGYRMAKLRGEAEEGHGAMHMVFTGNPGSAKTTVARLLATILKDNKILRTGVFVECGRSELVGKYVGWTAKAVKSKFSDASGGVLFIDEAYSLVDDSHTFGDEAINTIVQEMENRRDDVIVIFAGYPDKMKTFLESNEGLNSRIAFHVPFPDYSVDEMMQILDLMLSKQHFTATEGAKVAAREVLAQAAIVPNHGNGRLVRNVMEHAILKQALRLSRSGAELVAGDATLTTLEAEDIDAAALPVPAVTKKRVGFCA